MEQFRRIGEVLGSLKALMVLQDGMQFNQRQCSLMYDMFSSAFDTIAGEIRSNLKLDEKNTKWKALEQPLRELHRVFKEAELYIKHCLDSKDWWAKLISLHQNNDCIEFHIHNLLCCFPAVIEAIEVSGEISGLDQDDMQKKRLILSRKYDNEWNDLKLFQWRFGTQYLVPREICSRLHSAWREDRWLLAEALKEKASSSGSVASKNEQRLGALLIKKLNDSEPAKEKLFPSSVLFASNDYQVRRRIEGSQYKEIQWLGESFGLRQFIGESEPITTEIPSLLSLSHPNILQYLCGFLDKDKQEYFLVMELMTKDLGSYMKENNGARRQILFSLPVVVDIMLQIARAMEYLHSHEIYHGDLNPSHVFMKPRNVAEGFFRVKVSGFSGFGLSSIKNPHRNTANHAETNPFIWYAPEVLAEQEHQGSVTISTCKKTQKADVYSFGMICFELLTGKVPFEESHLQGEKMSRNIRAGERPLFPFTTPKYLVSLTKKCWHSDPSQRLCFSSICRILRHVKKFFAMNPETAQLELQKSTVDYCEIEAAVGKKLWADGVGDLCAVWQIPFQMFAFRVAEKEKTNPDGKTKAWETGSDAVSINREDCASICRDDAGSVVEDPFMAASDARSGYSDVRSAYSEAPAKKMVAAKKLPAMRSRRGTGTVETKTRVPSRSRSIKTNREIPTPFTTPISKGRRRPVAVGHVSDSDIR